MNQKNNLIAAILTLILCSTVFSCKRAFHPNPRLDEYVKNDRYSDLYAELTAHRTIYDPASLLFYDIILNSVTNKAELSNRLISEFRDKFRVRNDTITYQIAQAEYNNYVKLCNYRKLKEIGGALIDNFRAFIDSSDYTELKDDHIRYGILENEEPITLTREADTRIRIRKDLAGYTLLTLKSTNDSTVDLMFDTGANVNTLIESAAKKLKIRIIPNSTIHVMGATGARNEARIGIADKMTLGNMEMQHVEFVIFPDSLFTFAGGRYVINGTVGFPIFSRFEEITYTDSALYIPQFPAMKPGEPNMFIKTDDYILSVGYKGILYPFFFDTGNMNTYFSEKFYHSDSATFSPLKETAFSFAGVGGQTTFKARQPEEITLTFAGKTFRLVKPYIETESEGRNLSFYGSIGKDFMDQYKTHTMSFKEARIVFE